MELDQSSVFNEWLRYDPETGFLYWKKVGHKSKSKVGDRAPKKRGLKYDTVYLLGETAFVHRIVWHMHHGCWPDPFLDHINCDRYDNRIENLRITDHKLNMQNVKIARVNNKLGYLGVRKIGNRYRAEIKVDGKKIHVGAFSTPEEAHQAYVAAKRTLHEACTI